MAKPSRKKRFDSTVVLIIYLEQLQKLFWNGIWLFPYLLVALFYFLLFYFTTLQLSKCGINNCQQI